ncbi:MAG: RNA polymerase factor sigma-54 [Pseudomonadales bacterium]|nr:RNA polymerase factor sigma-54 [Pseudomonadales bacterium]NIX06891.1 RNA polymerase factor sigma-54 [Pseudomonadales bacterium]
MKQTLSLKLGQQLTMTPQLQQAIRLLQLSCLDLRQEIQEALEGNPMLELDEEDAAEDATITAAEADRPASDGDEELDGVDANLEADVIDDLPVDTSWDEIYQPAPAPVASDSESWDFDTRNAPEETLQDHLLWQLNLTPMSDSDRVIAMAIIDAINPDGMLTTSVEDLVTSLGGMLDEDPEIAEAEVVAVLKQVQHFDPIGVGARDLGECLKIQLEQLPAGTPWLAESLILVEEHLALLAGRDFATLKRRTKLGEEELGEVVRLIQTLNPRPGTAVAQEAAEYVVPDVIVSKKEGRWLVELNPDATPGLRINAGYARLVKRADNSADNNFLRDHLQEARWFLKSLQSRNETLLKVATRIVEHQRGFLEYGEEAMKPLVLNEIAEAVEMHESTISRVTSRKYMHTPRGIFELKYFFSSHVSTASGGEVSSTAIRALIKKLTADENPRKPLSDSRIATILAEQNINVARRTVAKYRESMAIPPSNERKRLV